MLRDAGVDQLLTENKPCLLRAKRVANEALKPFGGGSWYMKNRPIFSLEKYSEKKEGEWISDHAAQRKSFQQNRPVIIL